MLTLQESVRHEWKRVSTLSGALVVSEIRNTCRKFMTHDQREIDPETQQKWWESVEHDKLRLFLLAVDGDSVGFGVVRSEDRAWLTGGLVPEARGNGLGRVLFENLCHEVVLLSYPFVWLDVFSSNVIAVRLYEKLGFERVSVVGDIMVMKRALLESDGP